MQTPSFIIAGERRSGTSTLAKWLEVHPQIYLHPNMDKAFFLDRAIVGRKEWLDGHVDQNDWEKDVNFIDYVNWFNEGAGKKAIGEKSADYLFWEPSLIRIKKYLPEIKLVVTLRNPVDRAWSHYWNEVGKGRETLSFEEALKAENERIKNSDYAYIHLSYRSRGLYSSSLETLFKYFSKDQVHIVLLNDLVSKPQESLKSVYRFLGVNEEQGLEIAGKKFNHNWTTVPYPFWQKNSFLANTEIKIFNTVNSIGKALIRDEYKRKKVLPKLHVLTRTAQKEIKMNAEVRKQLLDFYRPGIEELEQMLGRDLSFWKK